MERFYRFIVNKPLFIIISVLLTTIILSSGILKLSLDNDIFHWFSKESKIAHLQYYVNDTFKSNNPIMILIETDNVFSHENLNLIRKLTRGIKNLKNVQDATSITEIQDVKSSAEGILIDKLYPEIIPENPDELKKIKEYALSKESYYGTMVSADCSTAMIIVEPSPNSKSDIVCKEVKAYVESYLKQNPGNVKTYFGGIPSILNFVSNLLVKDLYFLVPLVAFVVLLVLFLSFRDLYGTLLPLLTVLLSTSVSMGIMGFLGMQFTLFGVAIPVVLIAIGNAYGIHFINEYHERCSHNFSNDEKKNIILQNLRRLFIPILMSALTTFAGFFSTAMASEISAIFNFGIVNSLGVILALIFTLTFIPAILLKTSLKGLNLSRIGINHENETKLLKSIGSFIYRFKFVFISVFSIILLLSFYFISKIKVQVDYMSYFDKSAEVNQVANKISEKFGGFTPLQLYFKADSTDPAVLKTITIIEEKLRFLSGSITKPSSITELIATLNANMTMLKKIPDSQAEIQNLWFFIEGNEQVNKMVTPTKDEALITILLSFVGSDERYKIIDSIQSEVNKYSKVEMKDTQEVKEVAISLASEMLYNRLIKRNVKIEYENLSNSISKLVFEIPQERWDSIKTDYSLQEKLLRDLKDQLENSVLKGFSNLSEEEILYSLSPLVWNNFPVPSENGQIIFKEKGICGLSKLFSDLERTLLVNQISSLILVLLIVLILNSITFKSIAEGLISMIAIAFTIALNFGIMGLFKINLDFVTITVATIAVGSGIDYTIHYMLRYLHELKSTSDLKEAYLRTISTTGKGILSNSLSVGLGFAVLMLSSVIPLRNFGLLMFLSTLLSAFSALTILPVFLIIFRNLVKKGGNKI